MPIPAIVWTIAGFDPSSGAGVTADLMTFAAHSLYGCSAITALTVQSTLGVAAVEPVAPQILAATLDHLDADLPPAGVKIGMVGSGEHASVIGRYLQKKREVGTISARVVPIVFDPVLRSSSGRELHPASAIEALGNDLLPHVDWLTPNRKELSLLAGMPAATTAEAEQAARALIRRYPQLNVVATGGDEPVPLDLLILRSGARFDFTGEHIATTGSHGTGCAFSSALLANLVRGHDPEDSVRAAKAYVTEALRQAPGLGHGKGPLGLLWSLRG